MIETRDLSFIYIDKIREGIKDISLKVNDGEFVLITGPSGSGKSTLVRTFNGLIPNFYGGTYLGSVNVLGKNPVEVETRFFADKVGFVFQNPDNQLFMTDVESEIAFGLENLQLSEKEMKKRVEDTLISIGIRDLKHRNIADLSGGEKQKVAIAAVLAMRPKILVLDEPTSELDPNSAEEIMQLLRKLNLEMDITIILVEHRLGRVLPYIDRIIVLKKSRVLFDNSPEIIFSEITGQNADYGEEIAMPDLVRLYRYMKVNYPSEMKGIMPPVSVQDAYEKMKDVLIELNFEPENDGIESLKNNRNISVSFQDVSFTYPSGVTALDKINCNLYPGELVGLIGENGSGKSTFLKHMNGLLKPTKGQVEIDGVLTEKKTVAKLSKTVGLMFQNPGIQFYRDTLEKELSAITYNYVDELNDIPIIVQEMLDFFELSGYKDTYPRYLSLGEQQKASMAAALISKPSILALDEPTHGLDHPQKMRLFQFLKNYSQKGNTVIIATHDIDTIGKFADRIILMEEGQIIMDGDSRTILPQTSGFQPTITRLVKMLPNIPDDIINLNQFISRTD